MPKIGAGVNQILSDCCDLKPLPTSVGKAAAMDLLSPLSANQTHTRAHTRTKKRKHTKYSHYTYCNPAEFKHHPFLGVVVLVVFRTSARWIKSATQRSIAKGYKTADIMTVPEADNTASSAFAKLPLNQLDTSKSAPAKINWCMIEIKGWAQLKSDHHSRCIEKLGVKCRQRFGLFFYSQLRSHKYFGANSWENWQARKQIASWTVLLSWKHNAMLALCRRVGLLGFIHYCKYIVSIL